MIFTIQIGGERALFPPMFWKHPLILGVSPGGSWGGEMRFMPRCKFCRAVPGRGLRGWSPGPAVNKWFLDAGWSMQKYIDVVYMYVYTYVCIYIYCIYVYIYIYIYTIAYMHNMYIIYFMICVLQTVNISCSNSFRDLKPGRFGIPTAGCWMCIQMFPCWECCKVWGWGKMGGNEIPSMCAYLFVYIGKWGVTVFIYVYICTHLYICKLYIHL